MNERNICRALVIVIFIISACQNPQKQKPESTSGEGAIDKLTMLIEADPDDADLYFERGQLLYNIQSYDESIDDLQKAISLSPGNPLYYHLLSDVYMDYYKSAESLGIMEAATEKFPDRIPTLLKLSETYLILKQYDKSLDIVNRILAIDNQNAEAFFMMGMNFRSNDEEEKAINAFQTAIELNPEIIDAWLILGQLFEKKDNPIALKYYEGASNVDPDNPLILHSQAFYLQNNDRIDEAIQLYRDIIMIDKQYVDAYLNAGILYLRQDSIQKALDVFNLMASVEPQNYLAYYYKGVTYKALGNIEKARENLEVCLNLNPDFSKGRALMNELEADRVNS